MFTVAVPSCPSHCVVELGKSQFNNPDFTNIKTLGVSKQAPMICESITLLDNLCQTACFVQALH